MPPENAQSGDQIALLGAKAMDYLIENPEQLSHFMTETGMSPDMLRAQLGSEQIALGVMDYFARNESALLAMCANADIDATDFMRAWQKANPQS